MTGRPNHNLCAPVPPKSIRPTFFLKFGDGCLYSTVVYNLLWAPKGSDNVLGRSMIEKQASDKSNESLQKGFLRYGRWSSLRHFFSLGFLISPPITGEIFNEESFKYVFK